MKRKRIVLVWLLMAMAAVGTVNAQVSFIDQFGAGAIFNLNRPEGLNIEKGSFDDVYVLVDYWMGLYYQNLDSAFYVGVRTDMDTVEVGGLWDYHFTNLVGFSLGAGTQIFGGGDIPGEYGNAELQFDLVPYVRAGAFLHFQTWLKLGVDYTYKFNGQHRVGVFASFSAMGLIFQMTGYMPVQRTANHDIMGRWIYGDTQNGIELRLNEDFTVQNIRYRNGEITDEWQSTWSTMAPGEELYEHIYVKNGPWDVDQWYYVYNGADDLLVRNNYGNNLYFRMDETWFIYHPVEE